MYGPQGPLPKETATKLSAALGAAQAAAKTPYPPPGPSVSLHDVLFASSSPLAQLDLAEGFARTMEVPLGVKLEKASARWAGWESATNYSGSDAAPGGGYQSLVEKVLSDAEASGAQVRLGDAVAAVSDGETVTVSTTKGETFTARTVICTIPLGTLKAAPSSLFSPALPPRFVDIVQGTHVGVLEKLLLRYDSAWWPRPTEVGSYVFLPTADATTLSESSSTSDIFAASTLITANLAGPSLPTPIPALCTYLSETPARLLVTRPQDEVAMAFHSFLESKFESTASPPSEYAMTTWLTDSLSLGATTTPSITSTNSERSPLDFKELSRPLWDGRLGFAGEHTEMENRGSVAGAVISGQREAARVDRYLAKHK